MASYRKQDTNLSYSIADSESDQEDEIFEMQAKDEFDPDLAEHLQKLAEMSTDRVNEKQSVTREKILE